MSGVPNLCIIMPAYNEEKRIGKTIDSFSSYFENLRRSGVLEYKILIVINKSTDSTESIVKQYQKKNANISYLNLPRKGKGYAVIEGFKYALKEKSDLIGFVDADLATPPESFYFLIRNMKSLDGTIASRYIKGSVVRPKQLKRRIIASRMFNAVIRAMLVMPYRDTQCGAKLFRREVVKSILPSLAFSQYAFDVDILYNARKKGFIIKEVPTTWSHKGNEKINFLKAGPFMVLSILRLRLLNSPLKVFIRAYDNLI